MDYVGFKSGMSGVSGITQQQPQNQVTSTYRNEPEANDPAGQNMQNQRDTQENIYQPFRQKTNNQLNKSVIELKQQRNTSQSVNKYTAASLNNYQNYTTPQQESSYKAARNRTDNSAAAPGVYGQNSTRDAAATGYPDNNFYGLSGSASAS